MNNKYPIKTTAFILLEKIYLNTNHDLTAVLDISTLVTKDITKDLIQKAWKYLMGKQFIEKCDAPYQKWTVTITAAGIDWVEECLKIDPTEHVKE